MTLIFDSLAGSLVDRLVSEIFLLPPIHRLRQQLEEEMIIKAALKQSIQQALLRFGEIHPDIAAALFDETFMEDSQVFAEIKKILTPDQAPDLAIIERAWRKQVKTLLAGDITTALANFMNLLESAILSQDALKQHADRRLLHKILSQQKLQTSALEAALTGIRANAVPPPVRPIREEPDRFFTGFGLDEETIRHLNEILDRVSPLLAGLAGTIFEDHGLDHVHAILRSLERLNRQSISSQAPLTTMEWKALLIAAMLHNIGLCCPSSLERAEKPLDLNGKINFSQVWPELSIQVLRAGLKAKQGYPVLSLLSGDPVDVIVEILRSLPLSVKTIPDRIVYHGEPVRLALLAALLRLVASLDTGQVDDPTTLDEAGLEDGDLVSQWLRYYTQGVIIERGAIRVYYCVPDDRYIPYLSSAFYSFFLRRWIEISSPLIEQGVLIQFLRPQFTRSPEKEPMPEPVWAILQDTNRINADLASATEILSSQAKKPAEIEPYYYGAVPVLEQFDWDFHLPGEVTYDLFLSDHPGGIFWQKKGVRANTQTYQPSDEHPLVRGKSYRWTCRASKKGTPVAMAAGEFWLVSEAVSASLKTVEHTCRDLPATDRLMLLGTAYLSAQCYGRALKHFEQLAKTPCPDNVDAHRVLAVIYEDLFSALQARGRGSEAGVFKVRATELLRLARSLLTT